MKKAFLSAFLMFTTFFEGNVYAGTAGDAGVADACGTGCSYTFSEDGKTLTIVGTGENASISNRAFSLTHDSNGADISDGNYDTRFSGVENLVITGTISLVGRWAFSGNHLTFVTIPDSITKIGVGAFWETV